MTTAMTTTTGRSVVKLSLSVLRAAVPARMHFVCLFCLLGNFLLCLVRLGPSECTLALDACACASVRASRVSRSYACVCPAAQCRGSQLRSAALVRLAYANSSHNARPDSLWRATRTCSTLVRGATIPAFSALRSCGPACASTSSWSGYPVRYLHRRLFIYRPMPERKSLIAPERKLARGRGAIPGSNFYGAPLVRGIPLKCFLLWND